MIRSTARNLVAWATVRNLVATATWRPWFVYPCPELLLLRNVCTHAHPMATSTVRSLFNSSAVWRTVTCLLDGFRLDGEHKDCHILTPRNLVTVASGLFCLRLHSTRGPFVLLQ